MRKPRSLLPQPRTDLGGGSILFSSKSATLPLVVWMSFLFLTMCASGGRRGITAEDPLVTRSHLTRAIVMSCPHGSSSTHNGGNYKPVNQTTGIKAVISSMEKYGSQLPVIVSYFNHERSILEGWCKTLRAQSKTYVECVEVADRYPNGYGMSKIIVLKNAPCKHCLWLDCDVYPTQKLDSIFEDAEYKKTGTYFVVR